MSFLLDTNICSAHLRRPGGLAHRFIQYSGRLFTSTIVLGELYAWAFRRDDPALLLKLLEEELFDDLSILPFDHESALVFGRTKGLLLRRGISVSDVDLLIASLALVRDFTLVTHNTQDFRHIPDLRLDDWLIP